VLVEGASKRSVVAEYHVGWRTLQKILHHPEPPVGPSEDQAFWTALRRC
jgi:hypothetical protein